MTRPPGTPRAMWIALIVCVFIGVVAAAGRSVHVADFGTYVEPVRQRAFHMLGRSDPPGTDRAAVLNAVDVRFADHRRLTLLHVVAGGAYLLLAPWQLSRRIRTRNPRLHRWNGRVTITAGILSVAPAFYFGIMIPFGGPAEAVAIALSGGLFVFALGRAFVAIRRREVATHREWMLRALAVALGISVVRIVAGAYDLALSPAGYPPTTLFVMSLWTGWAVTIGGAEVWIRRTRSHTPALT